MKGKTETGFSYVIADDVLDDWEVLEVLRDIDKGEQGKIVDAVDLILGNGLKEKLKAFIKKRDGKVSISAMTTEFYGILNSIQSGKNS